MKKTSTRLASLGGLVILGACAIALAQHDSRYRERQPIVLENADGSSSDPIPFAGSRFPSTAPSERVVRANNDGVITRSLSDSIGSSQDLPNANSLPDFPGPSQSSGRVPVMHATLSESGIGNGARVTQASTNALRESDFDGHRLASSSQTVLASGQAPADPPPWLNADSPQPLPATEVGSPNTENLQRLPSTTGIVPSLPQNLPTMDATSQLPPPPALSNSSSSSRVGDTSREPAALPSPKEGLPQFPETRAVVSQDANNRPTGLDRPLPSNSLPPANPAPQNSSTIRSFQDNSSYTPSSSIQSRVSDMSDTQRGVMQATDLTGTDQPYPSSNPMRRAEESVPSRTQLPQTQFATGTDPIPSLPQGNARPAAPADSYSPPAARPGTGFGANAGGIANRDSSREAGRTSLARLVSNQPGNRFLDGSQSPVLQIQKRAPQEIQVGKKATFIIVVRNSGNAKAHGVIVMDSVPRGARFVESIPSAQPNAKGLLTWQLGEMGPGEERSIQLQIVPEIQGEVGSVATVQLAAQASVRTVATLPKLEVLLKSDPNVLIGDVQEVEVTVRNTGTGVARDVRLEADIPKQLKHESGDSQLEAKVGDLRPNEAKRINLRLQAVEPGKSICAVRAIAADNIADEKQSKVDVKSPGLVAKIVGPKLRYLERQATYRISVLNNGTAAASNLHFQVHLPTGLKFNAADVHGHYDPASHTVSWGLHELAAGQTAPIEVTVLPVELGPQMLTFKATGDLSIEAEAKQQVVVDGLSELAFTIGQDDGTIEVGSTSTYSVQVTNVGNKSDKNVQLAVELPTGASLVAVVNAPVEYRTSGNQIIFAPIPEMQNKDQHIYRFQVRHNQPGKQIVRTKLISSNWPNAVVKEEGTLVYNDQN